MFNKAIYKAISVCAAIAVLASALVVSFGAAADAPKAAPTEWFTDSLDNGKELSYNTSGNWHDDQMSLSIGDESEENTNKVLRIKKIAQISGANEPYAYFYPQLSDGSLAKIGEPDGTIAAGKTYRYIVEYKFKVISQDNAAGVYAGVGVSAENGTSIKNGMNCYIYNGNNATNNIGAWNVFNTYGPVGGDWQTVSLATSYTSTDALTNPVICLSFKYCGTFVGEILVDDIKVSRVADGDKTATVLFDPNFTGSSEKFNPLTYVAGAEYNSFPTPTRNGYDFVGWYTDSKFSELVDGAFPENSIEVSGKKYYAKLYGRWSETTLTDDFDQKNISDRYLSSGFSIAAGEGQNSTAGLKLSASKADTFTAIPRDLKGKLLTIDAKKDTTYSYTASIWYKASSASADSRIYFDLIKADTKGSISAECGEIEISDTLLNKDGEWHKAVVALRLTAAADATATVALKAETSGAAELVLDNLDLQEMKTAFGSIKFIGDEYTGHYPQVAGKKGAKTNVAPPDRDGYEFLGWVDENGNSVNTASYEASDYVVYPKWEKNAAPEGTTLWASDSFDYSTGGSSSMETVYPADTAISGATKVFSTDFSQTGAAFGANTTQLKTEGETKSTLDISVASGAGLNSSNALKIDMKNPTSADSFSIVWPYKADGKSFPMGDDNESGTITKGSKAKYIARITYKAEKGSNVIFNIGSGCANLTADTCGRINKSGGSFSINESGDITKPGDWNLTYSPIMDKWTSITLGLDMSNSGNDIAWQSFAFELKQNAGKNAVIYINSIELYRVNDDNAALGKVFFNTKGGELLNPVGGVVGVDRTMPTPVKDGSEFVGWYTDAELTKPYNGKFPANAEGAIYSTLYAKWNGAFSDSSDSNIFVTARTDKAGTGKTKALKASSGEGGRGFFNLTAASTLKAPSKAVAENERINWIVRFKYKADTLPATGLGIEFDIAKAASAVSCSVEGGTANGAALTFADGYWHTVSLPVSLTRSAVNSGEDITLLVKLLADSAVSGVYFDEFEIFDAGSSAVSFISFNSNQKSQYIPPIAGVVGNSIALPHSPSGDYSIGGWYTDVRMTALFGNAGELKSFSEAPLVLYGDYLTPEGLYAAERFDNTIEIYETQARSDAGKMKNWTDWGLRGKLRQFQITNEVSRDAGGKSLKYNIDEMTETYSSILLTDTVSDQIYLGSKWDEDANVYLVDVWYRIDRADTELRLSVSGCNYAQMWEGNSAGSDAVVFPAGTKTNGWQKVTFLQTMDWLLGSAGENANDIYALLTVSGQGIMYIDDVEYRKVNDGLAESIYFDTDGGSFCAPITGRKGEAIGQLPTPVKEGYVFDGWYTDYSYEEKLTRATFNGDGINWVYANFVKEGSEDGSDSSGDDSSFDDITDDIYASDDSSSVSFEQVPIYEDILEDVETTNYKTKTVITKTKIPGSAGFPTIALVLIIVAAVLLAGGAVAFIIIKKRKSRV